MKNNRWFLLTESMHIFLFCIWTIGYFLWFKNNCSLLSYIFMSEFFNIFYVAHRHAQGKTVILEESNRPYPRWPKCDIFVSHKGINFRNLLAAFWCRGEERKRRRLGEEEAWAGTERTITAYGIPLSPVTSQVPWDNLLSGGQQLDRSIPQPSEGTAEVGTDALDAEQGRTRCPELREDLRGGGSGVHALRVGDVGNEIAHWEIFGRIPPQGGQ